MARDRLFKYGCECHVFQCAYCGVPTRIPGSREKAVQELRDKGWRDSKYGPKCGGCIRMRRHMDDYLKEWSLLKKKQVMLKKKVT